MLSLPKLGNRNSKDFEKTTKTVKSGLESRHEGYKKLTKYGIQQFKNPLKNTEINLEAEVWGNVMM